MTNKRDAYITMMEAELKEWEAKIAKVRAQAEMKAADARSEFQDQLDELIQKQEEARNQLRELKRAGSNAWEKLQGGVEGAVETMKEAVDRARDRITN